MRQFNKKTRWFLIAIGIIISGTCIVIFLGLLPMQEARKNNPEINETSFNGQVFEPYFSSYLPPWVNRDYEFPEMQDKNGFFHTLLVEVTTVKTVLFVGDNVTFVSVSGDIGVPNDIMQIYVSFIDSHTQVKQTYNYTEAMNEIRNNILSGIPVIELVPENQTNKQGGLFAPVAIGSMAILQLENGGLPSFSFPTEGDKIVQVFVVHDNSEVETKLDPVPIFTVFPDTSRLQVTTEIDTIKQIRLQNITDADIVGLSFIAIGIAFVVVGFDILLRIYLEPHIDKLKDQKLFKRKPVFE